MLRELISWPVSTARAVIELPRTMERSIRQANELMDVSRRQLEMMRRQADEALEQAERMNELLGRVVRLTEPLERAQRGGELVGEALKRAIFGADQAALEMRRGSAGEAEEPPDSLGAAEKAVEAAEEAVEAADDAERALEDKPER